MYSIKENIINEIEIKKSRFITLIFKINEEKDINIILENIKKEYKGATHYCYAYIIENIKRFNDDGEPSGTAGMPILNILENKKINFVLCVVVRYFGGIKLGAGGLIRAYSKCCREAIDKASLSTLLQGYNIQLYFNYDQINMIEKLSTSFKINNKIFENKVIFDIDISVDDFENIKEIFDVENIKYEIKKEIFVIK